MNAQTLIVTNGIIFRSDETLIAIKRTVLRARRARHISIERAADAYYGVDELDYPALADMIGFLLANRDVFGVEWWTYIRGCVVDRVPGQSVLFRDALLAFVAAFRAEFRMLPGEPWPVFEPDSLADHLQRRGFK